MSSKLFPGSVRLVALVLALAAAMLVSPAHANHDRGFKRGFGYGGFGGYGGAWVGVDGISFRVDDESSVGFDDEIIRPRGVRFRGGLNFNRFVGVELHGAFGRDNSVQSFDSLDTSVGASFVRGTLPLGRFVRVNGLLGVAGVRLRQRVDGFEFRDDRGSFAFGVSMDVRVGRATSLSGGWTRYASDRGGFDDVSAFALGIRVGFF